MSAEEIASVTKFADEEVAKLDFTLPHYLMVHKLIYGSEKSIKVREPGFKELEVLRQKGSGREFLAYVNMRLSGQDSDGGDRAFSRDDDDNAFGARRGGAIPSRRRRGSRMKVSPDDRNAQANGDDVVTSNDVVRAIARLREFTFHLDVELNEIKRAWTFGDPVIVRLDDQAELESSSFDGSVPFSIGGKRAYLVEQGAQSYFMNEMKKIATAEKKRRFLEEKLGKEVTYDEKILQKRQQARREAAARWKAEQDEKKERERERRRRFLKTGNFDF